MGDVNPAGWRKALEEYGYEVDFSGFPHTGNCKGPPKTKFSSGADTIEFEAYFRETGHAELCPWLEVIYWKMFSQGEYRRMLQVNERMAYWNDRSVTPHDLWTACRAYTDQPCKKTFRDFLKMFGFRIEPLAIAATFPAFMNPDDFPMIRGQMGHRVWRKPQPRRPGRPSVTTAGGLCAGKQERSLGSSDDGRLSLHARLDGVVSLHCQKAQQAMSTQRQVPSMASERCRDGSVPCLGQPTPS